MQTTHSKNPFDFLGLDPVLLRAVYGLGYEAPTPIQKEAIPPILAGRDVIGTAQTGSGKTAAFLLPILQRLLKQPPGRTRALVLSPTRELAAQIEVALRGLAKGTRIRGHAMYGGVGMTAQEHALRSGVDVVVATPGRLLDHMSRRNVDFRGLQVLVLDEADRMLDMGVLPDVREEPHVEHPDRLVEDEDLEAAEVDVATGHVVQEPAGCRDDDIDARSEGVLLRRHANAPVDCVAADAGPFREATEGHLDLGGQFAGRREDEGARATRGLLHKSLEDRK